MLPQRIIILVAVALGGWLLAAAGSCPAADHAPDGNATIRGKAGSSEIVITTTARLAGAIHSLTWGSKEFIDSADHGRQLQSAAGFHSGPLKDFWAEVYNPTEAGSRLDGAGATSSSKLLRLTARDRELRSTTRMAFWLAPGEKSSGRPARNTKVLSDYEVSKAVRIGFGEWPHAVEYQVAFLLPGNEVHTYAQFEALTGYMPAEFSRFWKFEVGSGQLKPLDEGFGEQQCPVVFATSDGSRAMGVYSPDQPSKGFEEAGYGRFRFKEEKVNKWNCVFRLRDEKGIPAGRHSFRVFVAVGSLEDVRLTMGGLARALRSPPK